MDEWYAAAREKLAEVTERPYLTVPLQAAAIGGLKIVGFPGETFCEYGTKLREKHPALMAFGHCGGNVGYLPRKNAFVEGDYACYLASKLYSPLFAFRPEIEDVLVAEAEGGVGGG